MFTMKRMPRPARFCPHAPPRRLIESEVVVVFVGLKRGRLTQPIVADHPGSEIVLLLVFQKQLDGVGAAPWLPREMSADGVQVSVVEDPESDSALSSLRVGQT